MSALVKRSPGEWIFDTINVAFLAFLCFIMLYPLYYVLVASLSDGFQFMAYQGIMWKPLGFSLAAYKLVFNNPMVIRGFANSVYLVIVGTAVNLLMTSFAAYVLSRKGVYWKGFLMKMAVFTMFFQGGLVPLYLQVKALGLLDTYGSIIFTFAISAYNMIIMRTYFMGIPDSLEESAKMDGANDFTILFRIILPVAMPVVATMILFYGVSRWNGYFYVMIFLRDRLKYPISLILREILVANSTETMMEGTSSGDMADAERISDTIKFATTMVATLPILFVYPLLQKTLCQRSYDRIG
jgi:putative aldouronate transport system permease protein